MEIYGLPSEALEWLDGKARGPMYMLIDDLPVDFYIIFLGGHSMATMNPTKRGISFSVY
jgi:hypothetical protein